MKTRHLRSAIIVFLSLMLWQCAGSLTQKRIQPMRVHAVLFSGNTSISSADLLKRMDTKPGNLFKQTTFSPSRLKGDIDAITYWYHDRGFLDIAIHPADIIQDKKKREVTISIVIEEGKQTTVDSVVIVGDTIINHNTIRQFLPTKPSSPFSRIQLNTDQQAIADSLTGRGYLLCVVDRSDNVDSAAHVATVRFVISAGPVAIAGPLTITGTKGVNPLIIRRALTVSTGDTLFADQLRRSVRALYETGMFNYVKVAPQIVDSALARKQAGPISVGVTVVVEEADFYKIQGGVGYGTREGVRLSLQTSYGNVAGMGRTVGLDGTYSRPLSSLRLNYTAPWFLLLPPTAGAELYAEHHDESAFSGDLAGLRLSLLSKTRWSFGYWTSVAFEWVRDMNHGSAIPLNPLLHTNNTQSFGTGITIDTRDNMFDPTRGFLISSDAELAGLIGEGTNHFYKFTMDARAYWRMSGKLHGATAVSAGYVNGYGVDRNTVPPQELFFTGSDKIRQIRGFAPGEGGDPLGGRLVVVINALELRFLVLNWLIIAGFADAGYVWESAPLFELRDLLWSAGPGIRIRTPIGLISADLGVCLNGAALGKTGFSICIGEPF